MNYLNITRTILRIVGFVGFMLAVGAIGKSDYADAIGECCTVGDILPQVLIGLVMFLGSIVVCDNLEH